MNSLIHLSRKPFLSINLNLILVRFLPMIPLIISGIAGLAISEVITYYWKKKRSSEIYFFDRRLHHGEIGILLLTILTMGRISPLISSLVIGLAIGLIKDDLEDLDKWFKFHKR